MYLGIQPDDLQPWTLRRRNAEFEVRQLDGVGPSFLWWIPAGGLFKENDMSAIFEDHTARQRIAAEMIVAKIERNLALRRLQKAAIEWRARKCRKT